MALASMSWVSLRDRIDRGGRRQVEPATAVPSSMVSCSPLPAGALTRRLCFFVVGSGSGACSSDPAVPAAGDGSGVASEADGGTRIGDSWCTTTCGPSEPMELKKRIFHQSIIKHIVMRKEQYVWNT